MTVVDKAGKYIDSLPREQFVLTVDGKPQPITFFERVTAGSFNEEAQLAAARGIARVSPSKEAGAVRPLDRGRNLFFFVDDLHLAPDSVARTRKTLRRFISDELGQNDQAVIVSTSGLTGFLGQLTNNKSVLRAAVERLSYRNTSTGDSERPPMSEYQALAVDRSDRDALGYFIDAILRDIPNIKPAQAEGMVRERATQRLQQASHITTNTLASLESMVRSMSKLPGRKLGFFISDGFFLDIRTSNINDRLRLITDRAARSSVVIYTMDARGLSIGLPDAENPGGFDPTGRLTRVDSGELSASQEALYTLAADTGGRALVNTNALDKALTKTLKETSVYYLLAWQPEQSNGRAKFRTIKVSIKDRPDLTVLSRRGFFSSPPPDVPVSKRNKNKSKSKPTDADKSPDGELRAALGSFNPLTELPTAMFLGYTNESNTGTVMSAIIQIGAGNPGAPTNEAASKMITDVLCVVFDAEGKPISSKRDQITATFAKAAETSPQPIVFTRQFMLTSGLYQVRVAARDNQTGHTGSASEWIEIPKLAQGELALSSVFIGGRIIKEANDTSTSSAPEQVIVNADHHFARTSQLRLLTFVYNATRTADKPPDIGLQVQIFRDDQPIVTAPVTKVATDGITDLTRLPYSAEIALGKMSAGQYALQVTVIDRTAKTSASQRVNFVIE